MLPTDLWFIFRVAMIAVIIFLLMGALYLLDEFENERFYIIIGFITLTVVAIIVGIAIFRLSYHHICPLCGKDLGNRGDIVSRQIISAAAA